MPFQLKHLRISNENRVKLIDYLEFYVPLKNFFTYMETSPLPVKGPMLGAHGLWVGRGHYHATPAVTRDLGFYGLIRRTAPFSRLLWHTRRCGGSILTRIFTGYRVRKFKFAQPPDINVVHNCSRDLGGGGGRLGQDLAFGYCVICPDKNKNGNQSR
jgi:hypothetical protein